MTVLEKLKIRLGITDDSQTEKLTLLLSEAEDMILDLIGRDTNVITDVLKKTIRKIPAQITALVVAMMLTVGAFFAYAAIAGIAVAWYMVAGAVVTGFFVSYAAQFGFDKLKELIEKYRKGV